MNYNAMDEWGFQAEMKRFTAKIVDMMKQENLYASQGGPIILSQVQIFTTLMFSFLVFCVGVEKLWCVCFNVSDRE